MAHGDTRVVQSEEFRESLIDVLNPIDFTETLVKRLLFWIVFFFLEQCKDIDLTCFQTAHIFPDISIQGIFFKVKAKDLIML